MAASSDSEKLQFASKIGSVFVAVAFVLTLAGSWFASSQPIAAIDEKKLENYQKSLQSYAEESLLIAKQYEHNRSLTNYTTVSTEKIYEAVSSLALSLQTELPEGGLEDSVDQTAQQATELSDVLSGLSKAAQEGGESTASSELQEIIEELQS
jgi:hypothetical protein